MAYAISTPNRTVIKMATSVKSPAPRRTQAERRGDAESRLVQAAMVLVAKRGYKGFTLGEVGEAAGYSRGLPAHYFGCKEDLLGLVAQHIVDLYNDAVAAFHPVERGMPRIASLIKAYAKGARAVSNRALFQLTAEAAVDSGLRRIVNRFNARGHDVLKAELVAGIEAGNIRPDVDPEVQARLIYVYLRGQASFAILEPQFDAVSLAEQFVAELTNSIAVRSAVNVDQPG